MTDSKAELDARPEETPVKSKKKRSLGTVLIIVLTIIILFASFYVFQRNIISVVQSKENHFFHILYQAKHYDKDDEVAILNDDKEGILATIIAMPKEKVKEKKILLLLEGQNKVPKNQCVLQYSYHGKMYYRLIPQEEILGKKLI